MEILPGRDIDIETTDTSPETSIDQSDQAKNTNKDEQAQMHNDPRTTRHKGAYIDPKLSPDVSKGVSTDMLIKRSHHDIDRT
jgi:hypothetical protein